MNATPLFIPTILGTSRPERESEKVAKLVYDELAATQGVTTQLVDPRDFTLPFDGNDPENKDPKYTEITAKADAFFIVTPEYNHSFPGSLKRLLDSELSNYKRKPVIYAGVSATFTGGARAIEALVLTTRKMGMVPVKGDCHFPEVQNLFDEDGSLLPEHEKMREYVQRSIAELVWMARVLKEGREKYE